MGFLHIIALFTIFWHISIASRAEDSSKVAGWIWNPDINSHSTATQPIILTKDIFAIFLANYLGVEKFHDIPSSIAQDSLSLSRLNAALNSTIREPFRPRILILIHGISRENSLSQAFGQASFLLDHATPKHPSVLHDLLTGFTREWKISTLNPSQITPPLKTTLNDCFHSPNDYSFMFMDNERLILQITAFQNWLKSQQQVKPSKSSARFDPITRLLDTVRCTVSTTERVWKIEPTVRIIGFTSWTNNDVSMSNDSSAAFNLEFPREIVDRIAEATAFDQVRFTLNEITEKKRILEQVESSATVRPLGQCFSTQLACQTETRNCTQHGECRSAGKEGGCWRCECSRIVVRQNPDGSKKTELYVGSACEKVDVSVPFWLLLMTTLAITLIVAAAVSLLLSMGREKLPPIISVL